MGIGFSVDGNWCCEAFVAGAITEQQFLRTMWPSRKNKHKAEYNPDDGYVWIWDKKKRRKPWEKTDKDYRASHQYKEWRLAVFTRDNFTCKKCGAVRTNIQAHHIKTFNKHPKLRFEVSNGITLCRPCHINEHRKQ